MLENFHFLQPLWIIGLVLPLLWLLYAKKKQLVLPKLIQQGKIRYPALQLTAQETHEKSSSSASYYAPVIILVMLVLSLMQPVQYGQALPVEAEPDPVDLILVVNTSVSMTLKDYMLDGLQLDRMAMTRLSLLKLVSEFKGKRIALVILGRPSSIWLPLTTDFSLVKKMIGRIKTTLGGRSSDIAETLALIQKQFSVEKSKSLTTPSKTSPQKIVMLVSDGYEQLGVLSPETAVKELLQNGFNLHALAIGSDKQPEFSLGKGHLIYQPVDLNLMRRLAEIGYGKMEHVKDLVVIDRVIENLKSPAIEKIVESRKLIISLYQYPLTLALILLLIMLLPISLTSFLGRRARL